jgi:hypothetical protein
MIRMRGFARGAGRSSRKVYDSELAHDWKLRDAWALLLCAEPGEEVSWVHGADGAGLFGAVGGEDEEGGDAVGDVVLDGEGWVFVDVDLGGDVVAQGGVNGFVGPGGGLHGLAGAAPGGGEVGEDGFMGGLGFGLGGGKLGSPGDNFLFVKIGKSDDCENGDEDGGDEVERFGCATGGGAMRWNRMWHKRIIVG